jgi:hypothetical protein
MMIVIIIIIIIIIITITTNLAIGRGDLSLTSCHGGHGSISGLSVWDFWWTKWHWDRFLFQYFGFSLPVIPPVLQK